MQGLCSKKVKAMYSHTGTVDVQFIEYVRGEFKIKETVAD
jgi:hypothetical protein